MIDKTDPTNRDTVPAMLTPGEFVLNKEATQMFGPVVEQMNDAGLQHRAMKNMGGGIQNYNDGSTGGVKASPYTYEDKIAFIKEITPHANRVGAKLGIDPKLIIAQAIQETGWGEHAKGNNYFGIKSHGKGNGQTFTTHEVIDGKKVKIQDDFRKYDNISQSVEDYGNFLLNNPRYKNVLEADGLDAQLEAMGNSGYATDPNYGDALSNIIDGRTFVNNYTSTTVSETPQPTTQTASAELSVAPIVSIPPQMIASPQAEPLAIEQAVMQTSVPQVQGVPPSPSSFGEAFKDARADMGAGGIFTFRGNDYTTNYAEEEDKRMTANMGGSVYLNAGGMSIDQMARRKLQEDVDNAWFKRNERDALTKFDQANLAVKKMLQKSAAPSPMQTDIDTLPMALPSGGSQQEPGMPDLGSPRRVPPMGPPMPDVNSDESLLQGSSGNVDRAFKFKQLKHGVPKPGQGYGIEAFGSGNIYTNGQNPPVVKDPRELGGSEGYGQTGDATSRRAAQQQRLIALRENLTPGSPEHIKVSNLITGSFTPSMTSLDELVNYNIPASMQDAGRMMANNVPMGDGVPNVVASRIPNPASNLEVGSPERVAAIEAGILEPTSADYAHDEEQYRLSELLRQNRIDQAVADESGKTVGGDSSLKSEERRLAAQLSGVPFIDYPPIESANIAGSLPLELTKDAVIASGLPQAKTNPTVILQVANQRQTAEDAIEQAKRDLATAEAGIRNAATAEQVAKYEEMGNKAKIDLTTSSAALVRAQEKQIKIDEVDAAAEADKATLIKTTKAQADAAREAALSSLGFSTGPEKKGPGATKGPMIKTGPNGTILDANGKPIVNLTPQQAITSDAAAKAKVEADRIAAEGGGDNTPEVSGAMSMLKSVFGDLFDSKELIRAAIMYLGGRATGMDGNQALAFAGKNYIARVDAKEGTYQKIALEGKHTKDSLAVYKKTMNPADLVAKGQPAIETGDYKDVYHTKSGAPVKLIEKETPTGRKLYFYKGEQVDLNDFTTDGRYSVGSKDHDVYVGQLESDVISQVKELHDMNMTDSDSNGKGSKPIIGITPTGIATQAAKYVIKNQLPREVMRDLVSIAYQDAMAEKMSTGKTPSSLEPFFERAYVKSKTSNVVNFTLGNGKPAPAASVNQFFGTIRDMATAAEQVENPDFKLSSLNDTQLSTWLLQSKTYTSWNQITDPEEKKFFVDRGSNEVPPRSGFMQYVLEGYPK